MVEPCYNIPKVNDSLLGACQRPQTEPYRPLTHSVMEPAGSWSKWYRNLDSSLDTLKSLLFHAQHRVSSMVSGPG